MSSPLPSFNKPPVVETAISVQFGQIDRFSNAHLGLFWQLLRTEYPKVADAELVQPEIERFGDDLVRKPRLPAFRIIASEAAARLQLIAANDQTMVQVQNGRLIFNWRRLVDGSYPRWHAVLPRFESAFSQFRNFLKTEGLPDVEPNQWEVTYVNHLKRGFDWQTPGDWPQLLPGLIGAAPLCPAATAESFSCNWRFLLASESGRLHVDAFHGFAGPERDASEILSLQLTARGRVTQQVDLAQGLNMGRATIVRVFAELTGTEAHQRWEREQ